MAKKTTNCIWQDRKRHLRLPISFTRYSMTENRLYLKTGFLNLKEEEILLYRVQDVTLKRSLGQRIFGVGTGCVRSSDLSVPHLDLVNIINSKAVKDMISDKVEDAKDRRRMRTTELLDLDGADRDGDGIPDYLQHDCD